MISLKDDIYKKTFLFTVLISLIVVFIISFGFLFHFNHELQRYAENNIEFSKIYIDYKKEILKSISFRIEHDENIKKLFYDGENLLLVNYLEDTYELTNNDFCFNIYTSLQRNSTGQMMLYRSCKNDNVLNVINISLNDNNIGKIELYYNNITNKLYNSDINLTLVIGENNLNYIVSPNKIQSYDILRSQYKLFLISKLDDKYNVYYKESFDIYKNRFGIIIFLIFIGLTIIFLLLLMLNRLIYKTVSNSLDLFSSILSEINYKNLKLINTPEIEEASKFVVVINIFIEKINNYIDEIQQKENDIKTLFNMIPCPIVEFDNKNNVKYCNNMFISFINQTNWNNIKSSFSKRCKPEYDIFDKTIKNVKIETKIDNSYYLIQETSISDSKLITFTDISEINAIKQTNNMISSLLESIQYPILYTDSDNNILYQNKHFKLLFDNHYDELVDVFFNKMQNIYVYVENIIRYNYSMQYVIQKTDVINIGIESKSGFIYTLFDTTQLNESNKKLSTLNSKFLMTVENNDILFLKFGFDEFFNFSGNTNKVLGLKYKSVPYSTFLEKIHDEDKSELKLLFYMKLIDSDFKQFSINIRINVRNTFKWFNIKGQLFEENNKKYISSTIISINDLKEYEQQILNINASLEEKVKEKTEELEKLNKLLVMMNEQSLESSSKMTRYFEKFLDSSNNDG